MSSSLTFFFNTDTYLNYQCTSTILMFVGKFLAQYTPLPHQYRLLFKIKLLKINY